jgi:hypothetical protein
MGFHASPSAGSPVNPQRQARMKQGKHIKVEIRLGLVSEGMCFKPKPGKHIKYDNITFRK